ncbi:hypothetical protein RUM44_000440 [Polyplax serrata]|uniref:Uncharacterized protein n=1 Tax=Polyplax serrata TaxID=468196 RepID=A0ABR1B5K3_POLSC
MKEHSFVRQLHKEIDKFTFLLTDYSRQVQSISSLTGIARETRENLDEQKKEQRGKRPGCKTLDNRACRFEDGESVKLAGGQRPPYVQNYAIVRERCEEDFQILQQQGMPLPVSSTCASCGKLGK